MGSKWSQTDLIERSVLLLLVRGSSEDGCVHVGRSWE